MSLANDIDLLRNRVLAQLNAAHDYYADSQTAWDIVDWFVDAGNVFFVKNPATGTETSHTDLVAKANLYVTRHLAQATFQQFLAIFESYFFDFLRLWLVAYPQNLSRQTIGVKALLDAPDKDAIVLLVVNKRLNEILYERPAEWFRYLEELVKLGCPTADEIDRIAEAKATRDVLAHNGGVVNKIYLFKAGKRARHAEGEDIDISDLYHRQTWELIRKVVTDIASNAALKAP